MKKFVLKLIILAVIMIVILQGYNAVYQKMCYTEEPRYTEEKFKDVPQGIQICNFGSSHGDYGIDYSDYADEYVTFNFALTAQTLSYDYRILQQYEDRLAENGVMFILISNFTFGTDEEMEADFESKNERYYTFLDKKYIKQYNLGKHLLRKYFSVIFDDPSTIVMNLKQAREKRKEVTSEDRKNYDYEKQAKAAHDRHIKLDKDGNIVVIEGEIEALNGMIDICRKHNIRPVLITTPFRHEYNEQFDEKFYEQYHEVINDICESKNVEYYDYSHDERFTNSTEYMNNSDHLTQTGARVFTEILFNDFVISH